MSEMPPRSFTSPPIRLSGRHRLRCLAVWLLALLVPLQGWAVCLAQVRGPAHQHVRVDKGQLRLADFRRDLGPLRRVEAGGTWVALAWHGHAHAGIERHHHAFDDASVRYLDGERFGGAAGDDDAVASADGASFLPLPTGVVAWALPAGAQAPRPGPLWTPIVWHPGRADRPPRGLGQA